MRFDSLYVAERVDDIMDGRQSVSSVAKNIGSEYRHLLVIAKKLGVIARGNSAKLSPWDAAALDEALEASLLRATCGRASGSPRDIIEDSLMERAFSLVHPAEWAIFLRMVRSGNCACIMRLSATPATRERLSA